MAALTDLYIQDTYDGLFTTETNDAVGPELVAITDGLANPTPLSISSTQLSVSGALWVTGSEAILGDLSVSHNATVYGDVHIYGTASVEGPLITSVIVYSSGSNIFGDNVAEDTQQFTGSVTMTGSLKIKGPTQMTGSLNVSGGITGSLFGTASYAISASYALTSSYAISSSYALSSSYAITSSYVVSASYALTSSYAISSSRAVSSSYALSSSYAQTASYVNTLNQDITVLGTVTSTGFFQSSKRDLKTEIVSFDKSAIDIIKETKIVEFKYKNDQEGITHIGFIADDTPKELSGENQDKMDTNSALAVALKAIQEIEARLQVLENNQK